MPRHAKSFKIPMCRPVLRPSKSRLEGYPVLELEKSQRIRRNTNVCIRSANDVRAAKFVAHLWEKRRGAHFRRELEAMGYLSNALPS
ncbi:hypothetical protein C0989_011713, partial [Termitomyces sp. Mn162]